MQTMAGTASSRRARPRAGARGRARHRGGGHRGSALARARATRRPPTRPPSMPCAASSPSCHITRHASSSARARWTRAPMLYIGEEVGSGDGPGGRHRRRSARGHDDLRQGDAECARGAGDLRARRPAERARHVHEQDRHRSGLSRGHRRSRRTARATTSRRWPRRRACPSPRSPPASSTGRATRS